MNNQYFPQKVKTAFLDLLPSGEISFDRVARRLHMSGRTIQRRLREEGTSFKKLLDEARRELAEEYIRDPRFTLLEVAFILGYSDYSSFSHAYKRWTGTAPSKTKKAQ